MNRTVQTQSQACARYSHRLMQDVRIALCKTFASPYARRSHRLMRDVRIALCEMFASLYARCSYRSMRDIRSVRIEMSVTVGIRCLSNVGEALYPIPERHFIQGGINILSKSDDKAQCISRYKIMLFPKLYIRPIKRRILGGSDYFIIITSSFKIQPLPCSDEI